MNKYLPVLIKNMEEKIQEKTSHIEKISIEIKIKQKKNKFASQSKELEKEKLEIEKLKDDLNHLKNDNQIKINYIFITLIRFRKYMIRLYEVVDFRILLSLKQRKFDLESIIKKIEYAPLSVRKYSTSSRNTYLKEISKVGFYVYSSLFNQRIHLDCLNYL
jgi:hypothetical protein